MSAPHLADDRPPFILGPLHSSLLDLLFELREVPPPLTVGGGFGLYLKRRHMEQSGDRPRIAPALWPGVRPTNDLDVLLRAEVLADVGQVRVLTAVLIRLGYTPIKGAEYMQFVRMIGRAEQAVEVKVDLLVGPFGAFKDRLKTSKPPRVRPKAERKGRLHAYDTPEAVGVEDEPLLISIQGLRSTGEEHQAKVCLPQAFPYALMKLFAFRDQKDNPDPKKDKGRHHALDLYAIVAMMTEPEYDFAKRAREKYADNEKVREAAEIIRQDFAGPESIGVLRMREHLLYNPAMDLAAFLSVLQEIFA
jgi:hypothetical protein